MFDTQLKQLDAIRSAAHTAHRRLRYLKEVVNLSEVEPRFDVQMSTAGSHIILVVDGEPLQAWLAFRTLSREKWTATHNGTLQAVSQDGNLIVSVNISDPPEFVVRSAMEKSK